MKDCPPTLNKYAIIYRRNMEKFFSDGIYFIVFSARAAVYQWKNWNDDKRFPD
jgi:hypothetical protein